MTRVVSLIFLTSIFAFAGFGQTMSWLDRPLNRNWNTPNQAVPRAPRMDGDVEGLGEPQTVAVFAEEYVTLARETGRKHVIASRTFLEAQIERRHAELTGIEQEIGDYQRREGAVSLSDEAQRSIAQIAQLEAALDQAEIEVSMHEASLGSLDDQLRQLQPRLTQRVDDLLRPDGYHGRKSRHLGPQRRGTGRLHAARAHDVRPRRGRLPPYRTGPADDERADQGALSAPPHSNSRTRHDDFRTAAPGV